MKVRYFAWLRQRTGCTGEEVDPPEGVRNVADLMAYLGGRHPRFAEACAASGVVRCAVNQEHVGPEHPLAPTDEVAFFPPVTGG
ncbi:MAG: molybdopterin converting factor subunit 1 [Geminicoccaceae bacterium]|nr:molybdopterin converting factor subunit 1 [Geminicoccaceae bacterium]